MKKPKICAVIVNADLKPIKEAEPLADLFEVRIDLVGDRWPEIVPQIGKPWIACNRSVEEGGNWQSSEARRIENLLRATELGASIVDLELNTKNLDNIVKLIKRRTKCLLSFHDLQKTRPVEELREIVHRQLDAGADICKVVTTALSFEDNLTVLRLIPEFPKASMVSFAMGPLGVLSRVLCPIIGGDFTYAALEKGRESAQGQMVVKDLRMLYDMVDKWASS